MMVCPVFAEMRWVKKVNTTSQIPIPAKAQMKKANAPKSLFGEI